MSRCMLRICAFTGITFLEKRSNRNIFFSSALHSSVEQNVFYQTQYAFVLLLHPLVSLNSCHFCVQSKIIKSITIELFQINLYTRFKLNIGTSQMCSFQHNFIHFFFLFYRVKHDNTEEKKKSIKIEFLFFFLNGKIHKINSGKWLFEWNI